MKYLVYISIIVMSLFIACDRSDESDYHFELESSLSDEEGPIAERISEFFEKYGLQVKYDFEDAEYTYNWTEHISSVPYTKADPNYVIRVLDYLEDEIFPVFPEGFIEKYLQPNILFVDSLSIEYSYLNSTSGVSYTENRSISGNVTQNYLAIGRVSESFDFESEEMKEELVALLIERMMINTANWPKPQEFINVTGEKYGTFSGGIYWKGEFDDVASWIGSTMPGSATEYFQWWNNGVLKHGRLGCVGYEYMEFWGMVFEIFSIAKGTTSQDFADYYTFITKKTAAEKEAFFADVASRESGAGGPAAVEKMRTKMQLVKDYFKENFNITLQEPN